MRSEDYRRILDFFFSGVEVSEELKQRYLGWLAAHGDEPEVKVLLEEYWDSVSSDSPDFDLTAGLERLMTSLGETGFDAGASTGSATGRESSPTTGSQVVPEPVEGTCLSKPSLVPEPVVRQGSPTIEGIDSTTRKTGWLTRLLGLRTLRYCATAAAAVAIFIGGIAVANLNTTPERETVLIASSDNAGSYTLPDGTRVWLNRDSRLSYNQDFGKRERNISIDGEGYFDVTRNEDCPFVVNMHDNLQVKVLGTTFNVVSDPVGHSAEVILRSGSVQVSDTESKELVILKPDQKYSWDRGRTEVTAVNADDCCRWYEHRLAFDNVKLGDILESLSHKYQMKITADLGNLRYKRMSLTVKDESVDEIMEILSTLLPVRWERQGKTITIDNKTKNTNY